MSVFINYEGPNLGKKQKRVVRSQAMVAVRGQQRQQAKTTAADVAKNTTISNPRLLLPARDKSTSASTTPNEETDPDEEPEFATLSGSANHIDTVTQLHQAHATRSASRSIRPPPSTSRSRALNAANTSQKRIHLAIPGSRKHTLHTTPHPLLSPYNLHNPPPSSTHLTGVPSRTFQDYLSRCASYSSYLDDAFQLVPGFRQPSYFRPDLSKAACIYIGWLLTAGVLDATCGKGREGVSYPWEEWMAVRELKGFVEGGKGEEGGKGGVVERRQMEVYEVVYPVVILGIFEMVRFSPRAITHLAATEKIIKARGGLAKLPEVMQHLVIMADMLQCVCLQTPLAFNDLGPGPLTHLTTPADFPSGDQLRSSPLLLCDNEDFSLAAQYVDSTIRNQFVSVLEAASDLFHGLFTPNTASPPPNPRSKRSQEARINLDLDAIADINAGTTVSGLSLQTCALATRITRRTVMGEADAFDDVFNQGDVQVMYQNVKFIGLKAWVGLPYVYVWVNVIGFAAARDEGMGMHFFAEIVRCAFSYGCYQMPMFKGVLGNFIHLRNAVAARKMALGMLQQF